MEFLNNIKEIVAIGLILISSLFGQDFTLGSNPRIITATQGGTGIGTATAGDLNKCLIISNNSPFTYTLGTCGSGDVVGPVSSVDSNVALFDGTTGKLIKDSGLSLSSFVTYTGANVGIGTTTPAWRLQVAGTRPDFAISDSAGSTDAKHMLLSNRSGNLYIGTSTDVYATTTPIITLLNNGNVGIGTANPLAKLVVGGNSGTAASEIIPAIGAVTFQTYNRNTAAYANTNFDAAAHVFRISGAERARIDTVGNLGIGTTTAFGTLSINAAAGATPLIIGSSTATLLIVDRNGYVGVGTTTPWKTLSVTGTMAVNGLTGSTGTPNSVCINATTKEVTENAALTCTVSDEEQKTPLKKLTFSALEMVNKIQPSSFYYNDNTDRLRYGFGAQSLQEIDSHLADGYDKEGIARSIDLPALIAINSKAIQELDTKIEALPQYVGQGKRSAEENWKWIVFGIFGLVLIYQQREIIKLKNK